MSRCRFEAATAIHMPARRPSVGAPAAAGPPGAVTRAAFWVAIRMANRAPAGSCTAAVDVLRSDAAASHVTRHSGERRARSVEAHERRQARACARADAAHGAQVVETLEGSVR